MARDKDEILKEARAVQKELNKLTKEGTALTQTEIDKQTELVQTQKELRKELKTLIQDRLDSYKKEEESIGNINTEYDELKKLQIDVLSIASSMSNLSEEQLNTITAIQEVNRDISKLSAEEVQSRVALTNEYNDAMETLKETMHGNSKIVQLLKQQNTLANEFANKTEDENTELEESNKLLDFLKDKFSAVLGILETLTTGPMGVLGVALIGIGNTINAVGENVREFGGTMDGAVYSTTLLGVIFKDAAGTAKGLAKEFGGMKNITAGIQLDTNLMALNMAISGEEASKTLGIFSRLNGNSTETAFNLSTSVAELATASGLNTGQVMEDVASNAEAFALFSRDGGQSLGNAAVQAAKLGVSLDSMTNIASNLLDFETSITKELELGAMLGRNINLNRARQLAAEGKLGAMTKETIKELGGIAEFNAMEYWQRKQTADLLGVSVEELQKMAANMENIDEMGNPILSNFDRLKELIKATATGPLGDFTKFLGGAAIAMGQMGFDMTGILKKAPIVGKFFSKIPTRGTSPSTPIPPTQTQNIPGAGGGGLTATSLIKGAAAMLIMAGAIFVMAKALQEMKDVGIEELGMAAVSLILLGGALYGLSTLLAPLAASGILELVALGILAIGGAVSLVGFGVKLAAEGFSLFASSLGTLVENIEPLLGMIPELFGLALAFTSLAYSMSLLGTLGLLGLPVLLGISAAASGLGMLFGAVESGDESSGIEGGSLSEYESTMLEKMDSLISAVNSNKDVYLDKDKVTSLIMAKTDKSIINKLNIFNS
jgi:hypothetical protein